MYSADRTAAFKRDYKRHSRDGRSRIEDLEALMGRLQRGEVLPQEFDDHPLAGEWVDHRECKITPDWLLIYRISALRITFVRCGSHSMLFGNKSR